MVTTGPVPSTLFDHPAGSNEDVHLPRDRHLPTSQIVSNEDSTDGLSTGLLPSTRFDHAAFTCNATD